MNKICVIGLGYIGLPTAVILARNNYEVVGVDINESIVAQINQGIIHIEEVKLHQLMNAVIENKKLIAKTKPESADVFLIAVPTPCNEDKSCNLNYVLSAIQSILPYVQKNNLVIIESTIAPRTTEDVIKPIFEAQGFTVGKDIYLAHCPERVLPGNIINELVENNRIIGGSSPQCAEKAATLYRSFVKGQVFITDANTAEMAKLTENTFRDVNIALANELVQICNKLHINGLEVITLANKHPRVNILQPGPGVGGHCLAIDPYFIASMVPDLSHLISTSRKINSEMPSYIVSKILQITGGKTNSKIAILGATYKGNTDDTRESPAVEIIRMLKIHGFTVSIYDPHVKSNTLELKNLEETVYDADLLVLLADHKEFKELDFKQISKLMKHPILFDTKNILGTLFTADLMIYKNLGNVFDE